jgi:hypothetical protein
MLTPERRAELVLSIETCDPQRLIRDALAGAVTAGGWSPRELYLAWLLNLPAEIDAAHAAALLLKRTRPPAADDRAARALLALLRTTTAYPRERLEPGSTVAARLH